MDGGACLSAVRTEGERIEPSGFSEMIQDGDVGVHVVGVVGVGWGVFCRPLVSWLRVRVEKGVLCLALIVHRVESITLIGQGWVRKNIV